MKNNTFEILLEDHRKLRAVMDKIKNHLEQHNADENIKALTNNFKMFKELFNMHDEAEDTIVYPLLKEHDKLAKLILKAYQAHHMVEVGILELKITPYGHEAWGPKFLVIRDSILLHMDEEENIIFPEAQEIINATKLKTMESKLRKSREQ